MPAGMSSEAGGEKLSRQHGVKLSPAAQVSVEECCLAIGEKVGCNSVKFASRMNSAVVIFLDSVDKVNSVVESGVVICDLFTQVLPLASPARRVVISNVPPYISNEALGRELGRYGQLVSPIKLVGLGGKSPRVKHVFTYRRYVFMILKNNETDLNLVLKFTVENFYYSLCHFGQFEVFQVRTGGALCPFLCIIERWCGGSAGGCRGRGGPGGCC